MRPPPGIQRHLSRRRQREAVSVQEGSKEVTAPVPQMRGRVDSSVTVTTAGMMSSLGCSVATKVSANTLSSNPINKTFEHCPKVILLVVRDAAVVSGAAACHLVNDVTVAAEASPPKGSSRRRRLRPQGGRGKLASAGGRLRGHRRRMPWLQWGLGQAAALRGSKVLAAEGPGQRILWPSNHRCPHRGSHDVCGQGRRLPLPPSGRPRCVWPREEVATRKTIGSEVIAAEGQGH